MYGLSAESYVGLGLVLWQGTDYGQEDLRYARTELRAGQGEPGLQEEGKEAAAEVGEERAYDYLW